MRFERIALEGISTFRDRVEVDLTALPGVLCAVTGSNGAGKSSLLEACAAALYRRCPTRGSLVGLATSRSSSVECTVVNGQRHTLKHVLDGHTGKSEAIVLDETGTVLTPSGKVTDYDRWVKEHILAPDVFYSSMFLAQGGRGILDLRPGERTALILRVAGVERIEALARAARLHVREAKGTVDVIRARVTDESARHSDPAQVEKELAAAQLALTVAEETLRLHKQALREAQDAAAAIAAQQKAYDAAAGRAADLAVRIAEATRRADDLQTRLMKNQALVPRADEIHAAVARATEIDQRRAVIAAELEHLTKVTAAATRTLGEVRMQRDAAKARLDAARSRLRHADSVLQDEGNVAAAESMLESVRADEQGAREMAESLQAQWEALGALQLEGADIRIDTLRGGLTTIASGGDDPRVVATETLSDDDALARKQAAAPEQRRTLASHLAKVRDALQQKAQQRSTFERIAARRPEMAAAAAARVEALADADRETAAVVAADERASEIRANLQAGVQVATADRQREAGELANERIRLEPLLKLAEPLAKATTRIEELTPQLADAAVLASSLESERAAILASLSERPATVDVFELELTARASERERDGHASAVAVLGAKLAAAQVSRARLDELLAAQRDADRELADWTRLADDLGKDGVQAALVDGLGPALSALANDLLRCVSTRWTVSVDASRLSADGRDEVAETNISVIDTERGREGPVETLSGGEGVLVGEALSLALTMLACKRAGVERPTIVRDESGAALDPENAAGYVSMLRRAAAHVGADRVLLVTHSEEVAAMCDARLCVDGGQVNVS